MSKPLEHPANPRDDINRIIIGLGGQGSRVVNEVRKSLEREGPVPLGLDFIAVDSDRVALSSLDSIPENQRVHLAAPADYVTETIVPWLPHEFRPKAGGGCGMQRLTGKAMYLVHRHRILETVRDVARKLRQRTQVPDFMIVLVNAFGGGTGSGMAIDFALDVRADVKELTGQEPMMFGIGVLPSRSETIQRANGVAMLKELHFLLSHKEPILINGRDYSSPFELYFLVGREVMGIEQDEELLQGIVRFTHDLGLIPSASRDATPTGKGAGWVDLQDIRTLVKGAGHMFSTFGHYSARFPDETLRQWFETLDEVAALQKEIPGLVKDLDADRQALEDKKIALAHDEQVFATARARATRMRAEGVLGANRPDFARLLGDIGRGEESVRKGKREVEKTELELATRAERRATIDTRLREDTLRLETLKQSLLAPVQTRAAYTVPLSAGECEYLNANRHLLRDGDFASVMQVLGRAPDYHDRTSEVVGKNKILGLPLLNYRTASRTTATFAPAVLSTLRNHGFVRFDADGNPTVNDDKLWMVMAMLSSNTSNIDASKVSARAFKEAVEGHVARRAEVKIVPSLTKRFEVVIHVWMVGVQIAPLAPGYPPRLKELEWLLPEYDQVTREGGLVQHHAFLFGDPLAFTTLASTPIDGLDVTGTNERVTDFWASYAPVDARARWFQLPPLVAEAMASAEELTRTVASLEETVSGSLGNAHDAASLDFLNTALARGAEGVDAFRRSFTEVANPLRDRLATLAQQLEHVHRRPKDEALFLGMEELTSAALASTSNALTAIAKLRSVVPEIVRATLATETNVSPGFHAGRPRTAEAIRRMRVVTRTQGLATRLQEATTQTLRDLEELERTLVRVQGILSVDVLASPSGARSVVELMRPLPPAGPGGSNDGNGGSTRTEPTEDEISVQEELP